MKTAQTALIIDDAASCRAGMGKLLNRWGFEAKAAETLAEARAALEREKFDVAILDLCLPDGTGMELLPALKETTVILVTGEGTLNSAVEAFRFGVQDYLTKPVDTARLKKVLHGTRESIARLPYRLNGFSPGVMVGEDPKMQRVYRLIEQVAPTDATVFILGETGTGKELVARRVHDLSERRLQPFVAVNCSAIPSQLMESELFGHERGSFTGADRQHVGVFERADGGTLFLDEISEMAAELQVKLLRVLEDRQVTRIGGRDPFLVDVRVIAASNRDPRSAVEEGYLREDLMHRLLVFPIALPTLRERPGDIPLLAEAFLKELNERENTSRRLAPETIRHLEERSWKGNVRELKNYIHRLYISSTREVIEPAELPDELCRGTLPEAEDEIHVEIGSSIAEAEKELILATLEHCDGNKPECASILGISLKTLYNRLKVYRG